MYSIDRTTVDSAYRIWCGVCLGVMITVGWAVSGPALAQTSSPEIIAKERSDPASGEVVIINRKKRTKNTPDPYAPIKLNPLPETGSERTATKKPAARPKKAPKRRRASATAPAPKRSAAAAPITREPMPPLPRKNADPGRQKARLRLFPQAPLSDATNPPKRTKQAAREARPPIIKPPTTRRRVARRDRYREDAYRRPQREIYRRRARRERPWRHCRRLAWRCEDGFEGACYRWQQRCS